MVVQEHHHEFIRPNWLVFLPRGRNVFNFISKGGSRARARTTNLPRGLDRFKTKREYKKFTAVEILLFASLYGVDILVPCIPIGLKFRLYKFRSTTSFVENLYGC